MVSVAEIKSIAPTPRAIGGTKLNATSMANDPMTNNRVATVNSASSGDLIQALPMHKTPRLNTGKANTRFHQSSSAGNGTKSRSRPGARKSTTATAARYMPCPSNVCSLVKGGAGLTALFLTKSWHAGTAADGGAPAAH